MVLLRDIERKTNSSTFLLFEAKTSTRVPSGSYLFPRATSDLTHYMEQKDSSITAQKCLSIMQQTLSGLADLHRQNMVHGDLKHPNILMFEDVSKIGDFGGTRLFSSHEEIGVYLGDCQFQSPEGVASQKGDMYAAGIIFADLINHAIVGDKTKLEEMLVRTKVNYNLRSVKSFFQDLVRFLLYYFFDTVREDVSQREDTTNRYIDKINTKLHEKVLNEEISKEDALLFVALLGITKKILNVDAKKRPSAEEAQNQSQTVFQTLQKAQQIRCNELLDKGPLSFSEEAELKALLDLSFNPQEPLLSKE
jgi:serine/threonine protein kinase